MSFFGVIAAAQHGQAFGCLAHRFSISEDQAATCVFHLIPPLLAGVRNWTSAESGLIEFLDQLSAEHYDDIYFDTSVVSDTRIRETGMTSLMVLTKHYDIPAEILIEASRVTDVRIPDIERMLPHITCLLMAALHRRIEPVLRESLSTLRGNPAYGNAVRDPFHVLVAMLVENNASSVDSDQTTGGKIKRALWAPFSSGSQQSVG